MVKEVVKHHAPTSDILLNLLKSMKEKNTFNGLLIHVQSINRQPRCTCIPDFFQSVCHHREYFVKIFKLTLVCFIETLTGFPSTVSTKKTNLVPSERGQST